MQSQFTHSNLRRLWLYQLQVEFDEICLNYNVQLERPIFEISAGEKQLGCWESGTRTLRISEHLIDSYPWVITLQVLKHEMAHQYCTEVLSSRETAHGEDFKKACSLLGVLPEFCGFSVLTEELLLQLKGPGSGARKGQKVLLKIEKLLALGKSSNVHEAETALRKASTLIEKYHLQQLGTSSHVAYTVRVIETKKKQIAAYKRYISRILQDFFLVRVVLSEIYNPHLDTMQKTIELMGTKENVAIAEYCYDFLENRLAFLWKEFSLRTASSGRTQKNSYYLGVVLGFWEKLQEQNCKRAEDTVVQPLRQELLVVEDRRLDSFVQLHHPYLRKRASRRSRIDRNIYNEGKQAGRTLTLSEGVGAGGADCRRLIE